MLALRVVLLYCLLAGLWIVFSDRALASLTIDKVWLARLQICTGLALVAVTSVLFYFILRSQTRHLENEVSRRIHAEDELHWKTAFLEALVDSAMDGVLVVDGQARKILQNQRHRALWKTFPHNKEEQDYSVLFQSFIAQIKNPREYSEKVAHLYSHPDEVSQDEIELIDGTILERYSSPVRDKSGKYYGRIWTFRDITERKRTEQALRESNEKFQQLADNLTDAFWIRSPDLREVHYVSPAFEKIWGRPVASLYENPLRWVDYILPEDRERVVGAFVSLMGDVRSLDIEYRILRPDGEVRWVRVRGFQVRDAAGKLIRHTGIVTDITEQRRSKNALLESEQRFSGAFEHAPIGVALVSPDCRWLKVNRALCDLVGYTEAELLTHTFHEITHPEDREVGSEKMRRLIAGDTRTYQIEKRYVHKRGHCVTVMINVSLVRDVQGKPLYLISQIQDITERKQAEERIAEQAALIDQTHDVIAVRDLQHRVVFWNKGAERLFGWSAEEVVGRRINELIQHDATSFQEAVQTVFRDGKWNGEMTKITKSGDQITVLSSWTLLQDAQKRPKSILVIASDITGHKRAENELSRRDERFRLLIENASDLITILNAEGLIRFQSPSSKRLLGYNPEDVVGRSAFEFIHPEDASRSADALKRALADATAPVSAEYRFRHNNGTWRVLQSIGRSIPGESPEGFIVINSRDVTENRSLEAQFRQAQKMEAFGQLASGVAHDFNNILAIIQMQAGLLRQKHDLAATKIDFATEIEKAAQRGANLTRQLLMFSRRQTLQPRDLDLNDTITHIAKMLHRILGEDVQMQFKFAAKSLFIHADAGMMDQILLNLTVNARDAMPNGGQLIIETYAFEFDEYTAAQTFQARPGSFVCLSATDTGCGIPAENLPRIFEPFFTTKEVGKGTGLGLATVFGIVQQHQGWINVYSEVGKGTTFRVYLPRLTKVTNKPVGGPPPATARGGNETILLVEDDSALRATTQVALSCLGYRVLGASNAVDALEIWEKHRGEIRLLLTDLVMPGGVTGKELAGRLLQQDPGLKVIYTSGYSAETASKDLHLEEGVNFLTKPFEVHKLAETVRGCLDNKLTNIGSV